MQVQAASRSSRARRHSQAAGIPPPAGSARHRGGQAGAAAEARPPRSGYRRPLCRGGRAAGSWTGRAAAPCSARPGPARPYVCTGGGAGLGAGAAGAAGAGAAAGRAGGGHGALEPLGAVGLGDRRSGLTAGFLPLCSGGKSDYISFSH